LIEGSPATPDLPEWQAWIEERNGPPVDPTGLPGVCDYDQAVADGRIDYTKAHKREQVVEQSIINGIKREELKKLRGDLIPKDDVEARIRTAATLVLEVLDTLPELAAEARPAGERPETRRLAREWVNVLRTRLAEKLRLA
jgi:hypothetical protein